MTTSVVWSFCFAIHLEQILVQRSRQLQISLFMWLFPNCEGCWGWGYCCTWNYLAWHGLSLWLLAFPGAAGVSSWALPPAGPCALSLCSWRYWELSLNKEKIGMLRKANPSWDILDLGVFTLTFHIFWTSWHTTATFSITVWHWWGKNNKFLTEDSR